ncbi:fer-1-like protein 4 isoform X2 [Takifugu rubripes]|uniref:fer-1-like protein 4 isoform X2 n=1 Tax=Takifugu rubripes TaxID=31033 RepID=UPI0011452D71|nr:fer-1-like protein 4 isoform X2 [Takifugu rubripes]
MRLLGKLVIGLQHVVSSGKMWLREPLTDSNLSPTNIFIEMEIVYHPLEGAAGHWEGYEFLQTGNEEDPDLMFRNEGFFDPESQQKVIHVGQMDREARRLGRSLVKSEEEDDEGDDYDDDLMDLEASNVILTPLLSRFRPISASVAAATPKIRSFQVNVNVLEARKLVGVNINPAVFIRVENQKKNTMTQKSTNCPFYNENFQFEFQEYPEILFDKVIETKVCHRRILAFLLSHIGSFKIDLSTVYKQPDHRFYQKWAPLTDPADTRSGIKGYVKMSVNVLMKGDSLSPPSLPPASTSGAQDHIEKNLMLPRGMVSERPWARFQIRIYKAEGLPTMDSGLMAKVAMVTDRTVFIDPYVRVTFAGQQGETSVVTASSAPVWNEEISFIEQFPPLAQRIRVQILDDAKMGDIILATHFLDLQQISDPTRNGFNPVFGPSWINLYGSPQNSTLRDVHQALNEGLGEGIFYRGRILLALAVEVYSSHSSVTTDSRSGLSTKVKGKLGRLGLKKRSTKKESKQAQSAGATAEDSEEAGPEVPEAVTVVVEETHPLPEGFLGEKEDFLLFASVFEITMMDPSVGTKPVRFELSIGNCGKAVEVKRSKKNQSREDLSRSRDDLRSSREDLNEEGKSLLESEDELDKMDMLNPEPEIRSVSDAMRPEPTQYDRSFHCIPLQPASVRQKPCLFIWTQFEDHNFRLYQANWLTKMADRLEIGLDEVDRLFRRPRSKAKERLVEVLLELLATCKQFSVLTERRSHSRPNKLDRCRRNFIKKNLILLARQAVRVRKRVTRRTVKQRSTETRKFLKTLRLLAKEPQSTIPDVFLWLLRGTKRLAYVRIPAHSILFSLVEEQRGCNCGRVSTLYIKSPGGSVSEIFAKLEVYMWLGLAKYSKEALNNLPDEFLPVYEEEEEEQKKLVPTGLRKLPFSLSCQDSRYFQLRCHLYQGRGLMAAEDNGLSSPFAKVVFSTQCLVTRVLHETLSPAWCETLLFDRVLLEGTPEQLRQDPPLIIVNIYSHSSMGAPKPLGRAFTEPEFKTVDQLHKKSHLRFYDVNLGKIRAGELLASFELIELDYSFGEPRLPKSVDPHELTFIEDERYYIIPDGVRPVLKTFRIEVLFWGLRELKRVELFEVSRPFMRMECAGHQLESEEIENFKLHPNFKEMVRFMDVELPEQAYLHPPLTIFVLEQRAFGRLALVGSHVVQSLMDYAPAETGLQPEEEDDEPKRRKTNATLVVESTMKVNRLNIVKNIGLAGLPIMHTRINPLKFVRSPLSKLMKKSEEFEEEPPEKEELDWWSKYYASLEEIERKAAEEREMEEQAETEARNLTMANIEDDEEDDDKDNDSEEVEPPKRKMIATLKLYGYDLESEFSQFQDWLKNFPLYKGRANAEDFEDDEEERFMGKYKGSFLVYPIDEDDTDETKCEITKGIPINSAIKVLARVYIIKATNLAPSDPNGKADPYLVLRVGQQILDTKDRYIPKQLNPTFGEVFEFTVSFPLDTELVIRVMDHDLVGTDDIIGETRIDLENRFYSSHRASCGLALYYDVDGYNKWRDAKKPTTILAELCRSNGIAPPEYRPSEVKVLNKIFKIPPDAVPEALLRKADRTPEEEAEMEEHAALSVLHRWGDMNEFLSGAIPLVPEHVEIRPLQSYSNPGLPQGYLHMWVDLFPTDVPAPPTVDIKPRQPVQYELRVIIWNTDDVFLEDVNPFTGNPSSDIYVKGWIKGLEHDKQETDVHFNSLTGEGNFNWRFVFRFDYLPTEKEVVYKKKESFFSLEETTFRQPGVLVLQVWDYDRIGANDFLGCIELNLSDMVRGAKQASKCTIELAKDWASPRFSIFRAKKMKGWWPLTRQKTAEDFEREEKERQKAKKKGKKRGRKRKDKWSHMKQEDIEYTDALGNTFLLMGKVEAELQLVTLEQAEANPVGRARKEPEALEKPNRPTTSFNWFVNPMKTFIFLIWKKFKKYIIALVILAVLTLFLGLIVYTLPQQITAMLIRG